MIDLENLFLREETRISPIKSDTNETRSEPNGQRAEFDRIFQDHLQAEEAAKSGKKAPLIPSADTVSEHRSLAGGAQLILGGAEPTKSGKKAPLIPSAHTVSEYRSLAGGAQLILGGAEPTDKSIATYAAAQGIDPEILSLLMPDPLNIALAHAEQHLKAVTSVYSGTLSELTGEMTNIAKPIKTETSLYLSALSELVGEPTNVEKSIKGEGGVAASTLSALAQNKIVQFSNEASIEKSQTLKQQFTMPSDSSKLKLDAIYLGRGAEDLISGIETKTNFHTGLGAPRTESLLNMGQLSGVENRTDLTNKSLVETITNKDESAALRRQEQFLETSRRLTQAIGERLTTQITKGAWSVEMELHPKSLGRIEIQLEMRNGELAAQFNPSQNVTRDLLQESFDKLKAILAEHGIDSAYIGLGNGEKQSFDGKPTGDELAPEERKDDNIDEMQVPKIVVSDRIGSDGLDVQV